MSVISVLTNECVEDSAPVGRLPRAQPPAAQRYKRSSGLRQRKAPSRMLADADKDKESLEMRSSPERRREEGRAEAEEDEQVNLEEHLTEKQKLRRREARAAAEKKETMLSWRRILLLIMAVTVHNIPEGLAVGVGFASVGKTPAATFEKAFNLALGIGLQNFPEGLAVSLPLAAFGVGKLKAFLCGQFSGMVEPLAAVLGAYALLLMEPALPYALSFAAGAMIYVVFDDIIPEAQRNDNGKLASAGAIVGFLVMMCMDVGLG